VFRPSHTHRVDFGAIAEHSEVRGEIPQGICILVSSARSFIVTEVNVHSRNDRIRRRYRSLDWPRQLEEDMHGIMHQVRSFLAVRTLAKIETRSVQVKSSKLALTKLYARGTEGQVPH
jgi:hypothetical protein